MAVKFTGRTRYTLLLWPAFLLALYVSAAQARQFAAYIMDARTGQTLYSRNADARINPASLTKMMTLYITFQEIEAGHITLDTKITVSREAAAEPPSRLGLRAGEKIKLRYLIRAAAIKSANDAAAAIGDAFAGSPAAWGRRMTATAREMGMMHTTFRNANGLTEKGHLSTARDLTILARHLFYDFPQYYNLFSRRSAYAGIAKVYTTNHAFLNGYKGADGIKTGYTDAAGFNLAASAERGGVHIIGTVIGMSSPAARTREVEKLFDAAFRKAPKHVHEQPTKVVALVDGTGTRYALAVANSPRPPERPASIASEGPRVASAVADMQSAIAGAVADAAAPSPNTRDAQAHRLTATANVSNGSATAVPKATLVAMSSPPPERQAPIYDVTAAAYSANAAPDQPPPPAPEVIRVSTSGGGNWGVTLGTYNSRAEAERLLLQTQLSEDATLGESLRKVVSKGAGYEANFFGLSQTDADLACRRLDARGQRCFTIGPPPS